MSTKVGLSVFTPNPSEKPLTTRIVEFLQSQGGKWTGTSFMLCKQLNYSLNSPRALAVRLKNSHDELRKCGVAVSYHTIRGSRLIVLVLVRKAAAALTLPGETEERAGCSKKIAEAEPAVTFPWAWEYGRFEELTEAERDGVNKYYTVGKIRTRRACAGCGAAGRGKLAYRKSCPPYPDKILCKSCAEDYVKKARRIMQRLGGDTREKAIPPEPEGKEAAPA